MKELGRGGMGIVYAAKYLPMDRMEVLKVLNDQMVKKEAAKQRFINEMKAIGKLNHPFIATAYQRVVLPTQLVFSMEYVPGIDLHKFIQKYQPVPIPVACTLASQIATALQHAHSRNTVHRDIKPSNVMVFKEDRKLQIKILDFGLAKATSEQQTEGLTVDGTMLGTPEYMAPEQALDAASADIRADIYSLGCTLYHMLMGKPPFTGTFQSVLMSHAQKEAEYISFARLDVPVELSEVVARMMAKEPAKRYQTPKAVLEALKPFIGSAKLKVADDNSSAKIDTKLNLASPSRDTSVEMPAISIDLQEVKHQDIPIDVSVGLANLQTVPKKQPSPRQRRKPQGTRWPTPPLMPTAIGSLILAALLLAGILMVRTKDGTLVFENLPQDATVLVDGEKVTINNLEGKETTEIRISPGKRHIEVKTNGVVVLGETVSISAGERLPIQIRMLTNADQALSQSEWEPLFNGMDLSGWHGDNSLWSWEKDELVGRQVNFTSAKTSYLASNTQYQDFELKFRIRLTGETAVSGVQVRSKVVDASNYLVSGPQYNIRATNWGQFLMQGAKNGNEWEVFQEAENEVLSDVIKHGDYNLVVLRCVGKRVTISVNETEIMAGVFNNVPSTGVIAWQLWKTPGMEVRIMDAMIRDLTKAAIAVTTKKVEKVSETDSAASPAAASLGQSIKPGSIWRSSDSKQELLILDRNAEQFRGRMKAGPRIIREVLGTITGDRIMLLAKDMHIVGGRNQGADNVGTIRKDAKGTVIDFKYHGPGVLGDFVLQDAGKFAPPNDAVSFDGSYFKVMKDRISWSEARDACTRLGGTLAKVNSRQRHSFIVELATKANLGVVWLGASDAAKENNWKWIDGQPLTYSAWGFMQPNNLGGSEDFLALILPRNGNQKYENKWMDLNDTEDLARFTADGYVCEWRIHKD